MGFLTSPTLSRLTAALFTCDVKHLVIFKFSKFPVWRLALQKYSGPLSLLFNVVVESRVEKMFTQIRSVPILCIKFLCTVVHSLDLVIV